MTSDDDSLDPLTSRTAKTEPPVGIEDLEALACDPDPRGDLGYEVADWEQLPAGGKSSHTLFLPPDEAALLDDAFIVADESALCDLRTRA